MESAIACLLIKPLINRMDAAVVPPVVPDIDRLTEASARGDLEAMHEILVSHREDEFFVEESDSTGNTPITAVLLRGSLQDPALVTSEVQENALEELRSFGADFHIPDNTGMIPLFASLSAGLDIILYVSRHADLEGRMSRNMNFYMAAASLGLLDVLEMYDRDFNLNERDDEGNTVLHHAILQTFDLTTRMERSPAIEIVRFLCQLEPKPDTSIENNAGQTAYDLALEKEMYDVALELYHCDLPEDGFRHIGIQTVQNGPETHMIIHLQDTVLQVKQAFFGSTYRNFDFYYPLFRLPGGRLPKPEDMILADDRAFSDYNIQNNQVLRVQPKLRSGFRRGGKRTRRVKRLRKTRRHRKN